MKIYKYTLEVTETQDIAIPEGGRLLCAQEQNDEICVWALVNPDQPTCQVRFMIVGTGQRIDNPSEWTYFATVQIVPYVWHIFVPRFTHHEFDIAYQPRS